jgi:hypothetical protein
MTIAIDVGLIVTIVLIAVSLVGWEWKKILTMKREVSNLSAEIVRLHNEHQNQDQQLHRAQADALRELANAINRMNDGLDELTHYIRWLGQNATGSIPPPPLNGAKR